MVTELDHDAIKTQIATILKTNSTLYDVTGASGKVRQINVGHPDHTNGLEDVFPSIYITNSNPLERITVAGSMTGSSESLAPLLHTFRYKIVLQEKTKGSRDTENALDDFQKLLLETLEADHQLKNGGSPVVDGSRPETVDIFKNELNGKSVQGRIITYLFTKVTV
jgi:hypothetical protein